MGIVAGAIVVVDDDLLLVDTSGFDMVDTITEFTGMLEANRNDFT